MHPLLISTLRFQENSIKSWLEELDSLFHYLESYADVSEEYTNKEIIQAKKKRFEYLSERVFNLCMAYFETRDLRNYSLKFEEKLKPFLEDKRKLFSSYSHFVEEEQSALTTMFWQFLDAFPAFGSIEEPSGKDYLREILKNTTLILKDKKIKPTNETDIYNAVSIHCKAIFHDSRFAPFAEPFNKTAKQYKPDILVPSLNCAIEYKYAKSEKGLARTIDEILIDVKGYSDHPVFRDFFAVFYINPGLVAEERCNQMWKEKDFPANWEAIFIQGY